VVAYGLRRISNAWSFGVHTFRQSVPGAIGMHRSMCIKLSVNTVRSVAVAVATAGGDGVARHATIEAMPHAARIWLERMGTPGIDHSSYHKLRGQRCPARHSIDFPT
jgi:hypothetical protein